ncbi:MAG: HAD family phosphatase [Rhodospirillales bacterium]|nr:HAD family phosphatase [Rhodospirillales bacterium]
MILYGRPDDLSFDNVLFDFDGTLVDTESVFAYFDCDLLNEALEMAGKTERLSPTYVRTLAGKNEEDKLSVVFQQFGLESADYVDSFIARRGALRKTLFRDHQPPYATGALDFLDAHPGRYAMATNKKPAKIHMDLDNMTELAARFNDLVFCLKDGIAPKPAPDILLQAAAAMGFSPLHTAYIGDNVLDMAAGTNAGMAPIGFIIEREGDHSARIQGLIDAGARLIINDMNDLTPLMT